ncbi:MAG: UDP-glucose--hexose-1-phosphate uridylyltransferase [Anaerolineaceae bacterium]
MDFDKPHRRLNLLTGQWVLVSPHRARRPWQGQVEKTPLENLPQFDPTCYLCPGNTRSTGEKNANYANTFVFDNDFSALLPPEGDLHEVSQENSSAEHVSNSLFSATPEAGICRVVCFSPRHDLTLPELTQEQVEYVIRTWTEQSVELGKLDFINYVQVFENKGAMMGCSNPHPHSQIWAIGHIPNEPAVELARLDSYLHSHNSCLLCEYVKAEQQAGERIVASNDYFTALVPYWAVWPFETMLVANRHIGALADLSSPEIAGLADVMRQVTARYDNLFEISFPYSMGFHQSPCDGKGYPGWHLHAHYYPPLLRSATVRKFMVGFEMLAMPQRDLTPETAAERLRSLSVIHYKNC